MASVTSCLMSNAAASPSFKVLLTGFQVCRGSHVYRDDGDWTDRASGFLTLCSLPKGWGSIRVNPSELIGKQLDGAVLQLVNQSDLRKVTGSDANTSIASKDSTDSLGSATITFQPLRVSYREVEKLIPAAHESGEWDCVVHLGVAASNATCTIETGSSEYPQARPLEDIGSELS